MTVALLILGGLCIAAVCLKRALDRLDADMCAWANATDQGDQ